MIADYGYPTIAIARMSVVAFVQPMADIFDGHLTIGDCPKVRKHSRACQTRIDGPVPFRLRVTVRKDQNGNYWVRARPVREVSSDGR